MVSAAVVVLTVKLSVLPPFFLIVIDWVLTLKALHPDGGLLMIGEPLEPVLLPQGLMADAGVPPDTVALEATSFV